MPRSWQDLTKLCGSSSVTVERVRLDDGETAIEGSFELPPLARLSGEDQIIRHRFLAQPRLDQGDGAGIRHQLSHGQKPLEPGFQPVRVRGNRPSPVPIRGGRPT